MPAQRHYWTLLLLLLACCWTTAGLAGQPQPQEHWYRASVNHVDAHTNVLLLTRGKKMYVRRLDLRLLNIPLPEAQTLRHASEIYYPVDSLRGAKLYVDERHHRIFFAVAGRPTVAEPTSQTLLLTVTVDGRTLADPQLLRYLNGDLVLPAATMAAMGIKPVEEWNPRLQAPVPLRAVAGELYSVDYRRLSLNVTVPPRLLKKSVLSVSRRSDAVTTRVGPGDQGQVAPRVPGHHGVAAIFDYDLAYGYTSGNNTWTSGIYRAAIGGRAATCQTGYLDAPGAAGLRRLDSQCLFDWPEQMVSLSVGDAISDGGVITQPVRYGGIRLGTDFGLQPDFITLPTSQIAGTARVPSTLEVWVDQMLALHSEIPAGPFEVDDIPLHTGAGQLQATIISATGERRVINEPFYMDSALLAPGLADWSLNFGKLREGYASLVDRYTEGFAAGHLRYGLTSALTGSFGVQATRNFRVATAGGALRLGALAAVQVSGARSTNASGGQGSAVRARLTHQGRYFTVSYQWQRTSRGYQELAYPVPGTAPAVTRQLSVGFPIGRVASLSAAGYEQEYFDGTSIGVRSVALNFRVGDFGSLLLSGFHLTEGESAWQYAAQLIIPFGVRSNATAGFRTDGASQSQRIALQMNPPAGPGFGYRLEAGRDDGRRSALGELRMQGAAAELDFRASHYGQNQGATARLAGSVLLSGDGLDLSRHESGSYAVVHVGAPDVAVYHDGQLTAYSDSDGDAVIDGLRPYEHNRIAIRPGDVPLNVQPRALQAMLRPGRREVMNVDFGFQSMRYLTGQLRIAQGEFVPMGAKLTIVGAADTIAGAKGRFFASAPDNGLLEIEAQWAHQACRASIKLKVRDHAPTVSELGVVTCEELP